MQQIYMNKGKLGIQIKDNATNNVFMRAISYILFAKWDAQQIISLLFPDAILIIFVFEMDGVILLYAAIYPIGTVI